MARYFRRRKFCKFTAEGTKEIDYKDLEINYRDDHMWPASNLGKRHQNLCESPIDNL